VKWWHPPRHFAIIVIENNVEGDDFWVFIYEETLFMVKEINKAKKHWGEQILVGKYFKIQGHSS
jgi:hypothetical protein